MTSATNHSVDPKFTYYDKRVNKDVVQYQGLLDAAHRAGLQSIATEILQFPAPANDQTTIVRATVTLTSGQTFNGIGDANPRNVGSTIVPHAIRMAETRAKARALRDALNIGMVTVEELGGEDREDDRDHAPNVGQMRIVDTPVDLAASRGRQPQRPAQVSAPPPSGDPSTQRATERQVKFIQAIAREAGLDEQELTTWSQELYGQEVSQLNRRDASTLIESLQRRRNEVM